MRAWVGAASLDGEYHISVNIDIIKVLERAILAPLRMARRRFSLNTRFRAVFSAQGGELFPSWRLEINLNIHQPTCFV